MVVDPNHRFTGDQVRVEKELLEKAHQVPTRDGGRSAPGDLRGSLGPAEERGVHAERECHLARQATVPEEPFGVAGNELAEIARWDIVSSGSAREPPRGEKVPRRGASAPATRRPRSPTAAWPSRAAGHGQGVARGRARRHGRAPRRRWQAPHLRGPSPRPRGPDRQASRQARMSGSFRIGSPSWTLLRLSVALRSVNSFEAKETPPMPSRPVRPPARTMRSPARRARFGRRRRRGSSPRQPTLTRGFVADRGIEGDRASDGRDTDPIPVVADPGDHPAGQSPRREVSIRGGGAVRRTEEERIGKGDRLAAHGEHVAQYPPVPVAAPP